MAGYWIKLYIEILDDPKMAKLPDRLWRRMIELFLVAGQLGGIEKNGNIPDLLSLAWLLRVQTDVLELDMKQLETTGMIKRTLEGWNIVNFAKRQAAVPPKERTKQYRTRKHHDEYTCNESVTKSHVDQNRSDQNKNRKEEDKNKNNARAGMYAELEY